MIFTGGIVTAPGRLGAVATTVHGLLRAPGTAATAAGGGPPVTDPRDPAREAARRELAKRMYHENDPGLVSRALKALWNWLDGLFGSAAPMAPGGSVGLWVVVLFVVAVLAALWWRLGSPGRRAPRPAAVLFDDGPRSAAEHRAASEAHAAQGHWSQAVQERMRAVVRALEERTVLDARPGRTADEAAAEAGRALPAHLDRLRAAARDFDDVTYGGRGASEQSYRRLAELDRDLERTRPAHADSTADTARSTSQGAAE